MPRKSKVTAVPIEQTIVEQAETEPKTDAEQLTELVKVVDAVPSNQIEVKNEPLEITDQPLVNKKPQAKRAPKAKKEKPVLDAVVEVVSSTINETVAEVEIPDEKIFTENKKVECPDCGKQMSAKTLKYSHAPNCPFKKQVDKEEAQMKAISAEATKKQVDEESAQLKALTARLIKKQHDEESAQLKAITASLISAEVQKRIPWAEAPHLKAATARLIDAKVERLSRRQKQIESLVANAF